MKTIFILSGFVILSLASSAQQNNPYNQRGIDYVTSIKLVADDIKAGKVKDFSQETLDYYAKAIPLQTQANAEMATLIMRTIKRPGFNLEQTINQSNLSDFLKRSLIELYNNSQQLSTKELQDWLTTAVENLKIIRIPENEREMLLTGMAITDNMSRTHCFLQGANGQIPMSQQTCLGLGAIAGFAVGLEFCGMWCALGGAVIGAAIFGLC